MTITLEAYFEDGLCKIFAGGDSDSGISCKGSTPKKCAEEFMPYLEDYLEEAKKKDILVALEKKTLANNDHIDLSNKGIMLYDGDTQDQTGEVYKVLEIAFDKDYNLFVRTDCDGNETWSAEELSSYELELLLNKVG
jgi:hypothetical protein